MKRSFFAAAAATLLLATGAQASSITTTSPTSGNNSKLLREAGDWRAYYLSRDAVFGQPMCSIENKEKNNPKAKTLFALKYNGTISNKLWIHLYKIGWKIPKDTQVPTELSFDGGTPLKWTGVGATTFQGRDYVSFFVNPDYAAFLKQFAEAQKMTFTFTQGNEPPWNVDMAGSREMIETLTTCMADLDKNAPAPTQPFSPSKPDSEKPKAQEQAPTQPTTPKAQEKS